MEGIPDFPIDLQRECLLRVPYKFHQTCKDVCEGWKAIISRPDFYESRKTRGTTEKFICMLQWDNDFACNVITVYDPINGIWERLPRFPYSSGIPHWCKVVSVNRKLFLIGGWHKSTVVKSVFIYDFESANWRRGADMPTPRISFACSASSSNGLIYVAGGNDNGEALASAEAYNVEENKWEVLPPMTANLSSCRGVFVEGNFMAISEMTKPPRSVEFKARVEIYAPNLGIWSTPELIWTLGEHRFRFTCVAFYGDLYVFRDQKLSKYDVEKKIWTHTKLPQKFYYFECAAQWGDQIFVYGYARPANSRNFYMYQPSTGQLIALDVPEDFVGMTVSSAATVEI